jgi:hypothetical protein
MSLETRHSPSQLTEEATEKNVLPPNTEKNGRTLALSRNAEPQRNGADNKKVSKKNEIDFFQWKHDKKSVS